jgi:hypothetical protein
MSHFVCCKGLQTQPESGVCYLTPTSARWGPCWQRRSGKGYRVSRMDTLHRLEWRCTMNVLDRLPDSKSWRNLFRQSRFWLLGTLSVAISPFGYKSVYTISLKLQQASFRSYHTQTNLANFCRRTASMSKVPRWVYHWEDRPRHS